MDVTIQLYSNPNTELQSVNAKCAFEWAEMYTQNIMPGAGGSNKFGDDHVYITTQDSHLQGN